MILCSRDTILHIADKEELFRKFLYTLKPGGKLMISDYCHGDKVNQQNFLSIMRSTACHRAKIKPNKTSKKIPFVLSQEHSQQFKDYVAQRGYKLETVKGYGDVIKKAGFKDVRTWQCFTSEITPVPYNFS